MKYPKGHEFEYRAMRPSQIKVDKLYQRDLNNNRVNKIAKEFNGDLFNEPKVSYRDGQYWVFNGQHSIAAWRKIHDGEDKPIVCKVYKGMTWLDECEAFIAQNGISKMPTTSEKLSAALEAKRPDVVGMVAGAEHAGYEVCFTNAKKPNGINATAALFRAFHMLGAEKYIDMMTVIRDAWYGDHDAVSIQIINAMALFYKTYGGNFKREDLVSSLKRITPAEIIRKGRSTAVKNGCAREIVARYNTKRKYRLDVNKL